MRSVHLKPRKMRSKKRLPPRLLAVAAGLNR
jgi:hypothetical protein